jgi:NADH-quinone oxidoreductase subunit G
MPDTVTLTIDGHAVTVEKGKTVLEAALENGLKIPFYCYHPALGIDGSCRVCIVKIEKMPKLQTSCSTPCADGMVVHTATPDVVEARAGVFEFLLLNHPLDCPVCDKGGECPLQDYSYSFGPERSRQEFPRRVFDGEGVKADVDFGPTLMLNRNRCILCTRCVRFMRDVDGDAQINIIDRGVGSEIATFQEQGVHSLLSGNLMDVCPVGAILTKDYRFKSRPWDNPDAADTICTLCSKGCNTTAWLKAKPEWAMGARLARITPRVNPEVNGYWMCDIGRFGYHWIEGPGRLRQPVVRERGLGRAVPWTDAIAAVADRLRTASNGSTRVLASAHASHEELFMLSEFARGLGAPLAVTWDTEAKEQPAHTTFRVPAQNAPNVAGARQQGLLPAGTGEHDEPADVSALASDVRQGRVGTLYVLDPGPEGSLGDVGWILEARQSGALPGLIYQGVVDSPLAQAADVVLPGASFMEKEASYTNDQGRLQATSMALPPPGDAQEDWLILVNIGRALGFVIDSATSQDVRRAVAERFPETLGDIAALSFHRPVPARTWLQTSNPSERWKWSAMFQDLPPVKGNVELSSLPPPPVPQLVIPLKEVK